jgi:hypothetical protein
MAADKPSRLDESRKRRLIETSEALTALQFGPKQRNETAEKPHVRVYVQVNVLSGRDIPAPLPPSQDNMVKDPPDNPV